MLKTYSQEALLQRAKDEIVRFTKGIGDSFMVGKNTMEIFRNLTDLEVIRFALTIAVDPTQEYLFHLERKLDLICTTALPIMNLDVYIDNGLIKIAKQSCVREVTDPLEEGDTTQGGGTLIFPELIFSATPMLIEAGEIVDIDLVGSWTDQGDDSTDLVSLKIVDPNFTLVESVVDPAEHTDPISLPGGATKTYTLSGFWRNEAKGYPSATAFTDDKTLTIQSVVPAFYGKSPLELEGDALYQHLKLNGTKILPTSFPFEFDYTFTTAEGDYVYLLLPDPVSLRNIVDNNDNEIVVSVAQVAQVDLLVGASIPYSQRFNVYKSSLPNAGGFNFNWKLTIDI